MVKNSVALFDEVLKSYGFSSFENFMMSRTSPEQVDAIWADYHRLYNKYFSRSIQVRLPKKLVGQIYA